MKIIYKFNDGTISEVEVNDDIGFFVSAEDKKEENEQRNQRRRALSFEGFDFEGLDMADKYSLTEYINELEEEDNVNKFINTLTDVQRKRLMMKLDNPKISYRDIARVENVNFKSVIKSFEQIKQKFEKFTKQGGQNGF